MKFHAEASIGPYVVKAFLGQGGMGEVYRAFDPRLNRHVAIKVLPADFASDFDRLRRFDQEAKAIAQLSHPHIVQIFDVGIQDETPYLVMELLEGKSLRQCLAQGPIPARRATAYATQIAQALAAAHARGIFHRDLKPENVFVRPDDRIKVLDFGLAKIRRPWSPTESGDREVWDPALSVTGESVVMGTAGYMAPEQIQSRRVDGRADIYALGTILWEMLTGARPFQGDSVVDTLHAILHQDPPELTPDLKISPQMERVLRHCLEKNQDARFQTANDLVFALESLKDVTSSTNLEVKDQASAGTPQSNYKSWKKHRIPVLVAVGSAVLALLALAFYLSIPRTQHIQFTRITPHTALIQSARFSPDGKNILYSSSSPEEDPTLQIYRLGPDDPFPMQLGQIGKILSQSKNGDLFFTDQHAGTNPGAGDWSTLFRWRGQGTQPKEWQKGIQDADVTPDGNLVAVIRSSTDGNGPTTLECPPGNPIVKSSSWLGCPRFSPDGKRIAYIKRGPMNGWMGWIAVIDLEGRELFQSSYLKGIVNLAWSTTGSNILFTDASNNACHAIGSCDLKGRITEVLRSPEDLTLMDVSPTGNLLISSWRRDSDSFIEDGGKWSRSDLPFGSSYLATSPDGSMVAYAIKERSDKSGLYLLNRLTKQSTRLESDCVALDISEDHQKVLANRSFKPSKDPNPPDVILSAIPVGAGQEVRYNTQGLKQIFIAKFLPGNERVYVYGVMDQDERSVILDPKMAPVLMKAPAGSFSSSDAYPVPLKCGLFFQSGSKWFWSSWNNSGSKQVSYLLATDLPEAWDSQTDELIVLKLPLDPRVGLDAYSRLDKVRLERVSRSTGARRPDRSILAKSNSVYDYMIPSGTARPIMAAVGDVRGNLFLVEGVISH